MKKIATIIALAFFAIATPLLQTGCQTPPSSRNIQFQTLKAVGYAANDAVALSARLYNDKVITAEQAREVIDFFNNRFQPAYRLAVMTARSHLDSLASPEILSLAGELSALVVKYQVNPL